MPGWPTCVGSGDSPPWGRVPSVTSAASSGPPPGFALPDSWDQHSPRQKLCHADGLLPDAGFNPMGFPGGAGGKETACQLRRCKRCEFDLWVGKTPWRRAWQPILALFPGEYPCTVEPDRLQTYWEESDTTERSSTGCLTVGTSCCALSCELWGLRLSLSPSASLHRPPSARSSIGVGCLLHQEGRRLGNEGLRTHIKIFESTDTITNTCIPIAAVKTWILTTIF